MTHRSPLRAEAIAAERLRLRALEDAPLAVVLSHDVWCACSTCAEHGPRVNALAEEFVVAAERALSRGRP